MPNAIDNAIARLQNIAQACTSVTIKSAPDYPVENIEPFPFSFGYIKGGEFNFTNNSMHLNFPILRFEVYFSRVNLRQSYQQTDAIAIEFPKRLAGDPTLDNTVDTIVATLDQPIPYEVLDVVMSPEGKTPIITAKMIGFDIKIKTIQTPQSTST